MSKNLKVLIKGNFLCCYQYHHYQLGEKRDCYKFRARCWNFTTECEDQTKDQIKDLNDPYAKIFKIDYFKAYQPNNGYDIV